MRRRLFNVLATLSLVCFIAIVATWLRGYWRGDFVRIGTWNEIAEGQFRYNRLKVTSSSGGAQLWFGRGDISRKEIEPDIFSGMSGRFLYLQWRAPHLRYPYSGYSDSEQQILGPSFGFEIATSSSRHERYLCFTAPMWFYCALTAVLPLIAVRRWRRSRLRKRRGLCVRCGYDLRATGERCPECGTPVPAPTTTAHA